jgi:hypothetical protein
VIEYEALHERAIELKNAIVTFRKDKAKESALVKSVESFEGGIRDWWQKRHVQICDSAFELGLFMSAISVCSLAGAAGNVSVLISAALFGRKSAASILKGIGKRLWHRD